jgi:hypothetical protein
MGRGNSANAGQHQKREEKVTTATTAKQIDVVLFAKPAVQTKHCNMHQSSDKWKRTEGRRERTICVSRM